MSLGMGALEGLVLPHLRAWSNAGSQGAREGASRPGWHQGPAGRVCGALCNDSTCENTESLNPGSGESINQDKKGLSTESQGEATFSENGVFSAILKEYFDMMIVKSVVRLLEVP